MGFLGNMENLGKKIIDGASNIIGGGSNALFGSAPAMQDYNINKASFGNPFAAQTRTDLNTALAGLQGRGENDPFRQAQLAQMGQLQAQASGTAPSLAEMQMRQAQDRGLAQQQGAMASNRGVGSALAQRMLAQNAATSNQQMAGDVGMARLQEQQGAQNQLAQALSQGRTGDIQSGSLNDQMAQFYQQSLMDQAEKDRQAQIEYERMNVNKVTGQNNAANDQFAQTSQNRQKVVGGIGSILGIGRK